MLFANRRIQIIKHYYHLLCGFKLINDSSSGFKYVLFLKAYFELFSINAKSTIFF